MARSPRRHRRSAPSSSPAQPASSKASYSSTLNPNEHSCIVLRLLNPKECSSGFFLFCFSACEGGAQATADTGQEQGQGQGQQWLGSADRQAYKDTRACLHVRIRERQERERERERDIYIYIYGERERMRERERTARDRQINLEN